MPSNYGVFSMSMSARACALLVLIAAIAAGCSSSGAASAPASSPVTRPSVSPDLPPTVPPSDAPVTGEVPESTLEAVRQQLAVDAPGADLASATVVRAEAVEWSDGSLGCPEPGMLYTQAITPGYQVVISVDGVEYDYRATEAGQVRLCETPGPIGT
jgi:hypothetical protein